MHNVDSNRGNARAGESPDTAYGDRATQMRAFFKALTKLPLEEWIRAVQTTQDVDGDATARDDSTARSRRAAVRHLATLLETNPAARNRTDKRVSDIVEIACGMTNETVHRRLSKASLTAAQAVLARPELSPEEFAVLYEPFRELIPPRQLELSS